jgi:hypothetical protein
MKWRVLHFVGSSVRLGWRQGDGGGVFIVGLVIEEPVLTTGEAVTKPAAKRTRDKNVKREDNMTVDGRDSAVTTR